MSNWIMKLYDLYFQEFVEYMHDQLLKCEYIKNPFIKQYQFHTQADISLSRQNLSYEPKFSLEDGIKSYIPEIKKIYESIKNEA